MMRYRDFGRLGWKVSALGFGCMRLPTRGGDSQNPEVDQAQAVRMIRHAVDQGVNYVDTAYVYHGGASETVLGKALGDGYRAKVRLATKAPLWSVRNRADFDRHLSEQLRRLQSDHIDFYLLHALDRRLWRDTVLRLGLLEQAEKAKRDGRIGHLGFSFHDGAEIFREILDGYPGWEFCLLQYNYMDTANQAGTAGVKLAAERGLAVAVMEPLLGGRLANPPAKIRETFEAHEPKRTPAEWALQWLWDQPEVATVLSGMSSPSQVEANLEAACRSDIGSLAPADRDLIARVREKYLGRTTVDCTKCNYCVPCPTGVNIPMNFEIYNDAFLHEDAPGARFLYTLLLDPTTFAGACSACRECEEKCPQKIPISEWMPKMHAFLSGAAG